MEAHRHDSAARAGAGAAEFEISRVSIREERNRQQSRSVGVAPSKMANMIGPERDRRSGQRLWRTGGAAEQVDFTVQRDDETVNPLALKNRVEFRAMHRELADRPVEIDVGNLP